MVGMMKRYSFSGALQSALVIAVLLTMTGCDDLLVKAPLGQETSETFFTTQEHAVQATNATYNQLRQWNTHVFAWIGLTDITSDDATKGSTPADAPQMLRLDNLDFDPGEGPFNEAWRGYYQGIYRANLAIANIPGIDMDAGLRARLVGENQFLRAYFYFFLVRGFGGVPLITEPLPAGSYEQPRATAEEIYAQIERDLLAAAEVLPHKSEYGAGDMGRATRGAAHGLLARMYLFQGDYEAAGRHAREVIDSGEYSLYPNFAEIFRPSGENSSESVYEIQAVALEQGGGGSQYSQVQGVRGSPNLGWGFNQPSDELENAFEPGDPRQGATILYPWEPLPDDSDLFVFANSSITNQRYNQKAFASIGQPGGMDNAGTNIRRIRYADVLLMAAEAAYHNGNVGDAQFYVNEVRQRARNGHSATLGIIVETIPSMQAEHIGFDAGSPGVLVRWAHPDGAAAAAGFASPEYAFVAGRPLQRVVHSDIITSINGTAVDTRDAFMQVMAGVSPGETVELEVATVSQTFGGGSFTTERTDWTANVTAQELLPNVTATGQALLEAIWHERRVELAMEQHRWFDLLRQDQVMPGRAAAMLSAHGKEFQERHRLFPIPQPEIDLSGGLMNQNPGYN